ncbi:hypothetical protein FJK98_12650 [Micromonospora sp. HM134]|uniref:tyrosine-type recombinase/integrase n=1 Tax=Micromonospora sp. HM134 TaxID=2583243 RepID=UPI001198440B|nr:tyrosine-type recombinase/integrase [Micromonospora sp. HM134]QDY07908.1 hypothetical protein FJK98_12650 [Micromonospora sp. HM134]
MLSSMTQGDAGHEVPTATCGRADRCLNPASRRRSCEIADLDARALFVHSTLVSVDNSRSMFNAPNTHGSRAWIALSTRAVDALQRQRRRQCRQQVPTRHHDNLDLVFARPDGQPLRPQYVLDHLRRLTADAGLPAIRVHDLRHIAATITINRGVPIAVVSKTLRHSNMATTIDTYGHLTRDAAVTHAVPTIRPCG